MSKKTATDKVTHIITLSSTIIFIFFVTALIGSLIWHSVPSIRRFGVSFLHSSNWNIKFLELSNVQKKENSFILTFTSILSPIQQSDIRLEFGSQPVPFDITTSQRTVSITPKKTLTAGTYHIYLNTTIRDQFQNPLIKEVYWVSTIDNSGKITQNNIIDNETKKNYQLIRNENERYFGILAFITGTILSSILALIMGFPVALSAALYLTEYAHPKSKSAKIFAVLIDLLAGIPSVIYGLWALFFLVPYMGATLFTASVVLAIMTIPYTTSLTKEALSLVPQKLRDAGLGLGASQFQVITKVILPYAQSGIIAGILLTLGRALGETLAVTMVIGNRNQIPKNIFEPAQTIASLIANEYGEASGLKQSALIEAGLVLIIITLLFSLLGRLVIRWSTREKRGV